MRRQDAIPGASPLHDRIEGSALLCSDSRMHAGRQHPLVFRLCVVLYVVMIHVPLLALRPLSKQLRRMRGQLAVRRCRLSNTFDRIELRIVQSCACRNTAPRFASNAHCMVSQVMSCRFQSRLRRSGRTCCSELKKRSLCSVLHASLSLSNASIGLNTLLDRIYQFKSCLGSGTSRCHGSLATDAVTLEQHEQ